MIGQKSITLVSKVQTHSEEQAENSGQGQQGYLCEEFLDRIKHFGAAILNGFSYASGIGFLI